MQEYTVKQISEMLHTNPETVRRWIRTGKLKATQNSKKNGNIITDTAFQQFLKTMQKYAAMLMTLPVTASASSISFSTGILLSGLISLFSIHNNHHVTPKEVKHYIQNEITKSTDTIERKKEIINRLQLELKEEQNKLNGLTQILANEDYNKIANEINSKHTNN